MAYVETEQKIVDGDTDFYLETHIIVPSGL